MTDPQSLRVAERDSNVPTSDLTKSERRVICYNSKCEDYRVERNYDVACSCKKTRVVGAGV